MLLVLLAVARAEVVCVPDSAGTETCNAFSVEEALDAGFALLELTPGTHVGSVLDQPGVHIRALDPADPPIITVGEAGREEVFEITANDVTLESLVILPQRLDHQARGVTIVGADNVALIDVEVISGSNADGGGGVFIDRNAGVSITRGRYARGETSLGCGGNLTVSGRSQVIVTGATVEAGSAVWGGGVCVNSSARVEFYDTEFIDNIAGNDGGHIIVNGSATVWAEDSTFQGGQSAKGAAIYGFDANEIKVTASLFFDQAASLRGDDIHVSSSTSVRVEDSQFVGGMRAVGASAVSIEATTSAVLMSNHFIDAVGLDGGGVHLLDVDFADVGDSWFCSTVANRGAGVWVKGGCSNDCKVNNNVFYAGLASVSGGGVGVLDPVGQVTIDQNTFIGNQAQSDGGAAAFTTGVGFSRNLVLGNGSPSGAVLTDVEGLSRVITNGFWENDGGNVADNLTLPPSNRSLLDQPALLASAVTVINACNDAVFVDPTAVPNQWLVDNEVGAWSADGDGDGVGEAFDCEDGNAGVHAFADEIPADGVDQDCDGMELCFVDADGDGFGVREVVSSSNLLCNGSGESLTTGDCDDTDVESFPGANEVPYDGQDQDCSGEDDDDLDGDGVPFPLDCDDEDVRVGRCDVWVGGARCTTGPGAIPMGLLVLALAMVRRRRGEGE